jgi:hypothetical protein
VVAVVAAEADDFLRVGNGRGQPSFVSRYPDSVGSFRGAGNIPQLFWAGSQKLPQRWRKRRIGGVEVDVAVILAHSWAQAGRGVKGCETH